MLFSVASLLFAAVSAQNAFNQILFPANNVVIQAGGGVQSITWTNLTSGQVSVSLFSGTNPLVEVAPLASGIANTGTFLWTPETWLPAANDYVIAVRDLSGSAPTQYSPYFTVQLCSTCSASTRSSTSSFSVQTVSVAGLVTRQSFTQAFPTPTSNTGASASSAAASAGGVAGGASGSAASGASAASSAVASDSGASAASGSVASVTGSQSARSGSAAASGSRTGSAAVSGTAAAATSRAAAVANKENAAGLVFAAGLAAWLF